MSESLVINHAVKAGCEQQYEHLVSEIVKICHGFDGHHGTQVLRPVGRQRKDYTIIVRFDTHDNALRWVNSSERKAFIAAVNDLLDSGDQYEFYDGFEYWLGGESSSAHKPPRWKQFLITWSAIYPLATVMVMLSSWLFTVADIHLSIYLQMLPVTAVVVYLMVYLVMPRYMKLAHNWLFKR